ncbi:MAG: hypothetical protein H6698_05435 [Myxococcales bacterium]|nr:hypothetical protein [Myxococcales bacterium]MCB9530232.1 hypothetical protein [Myxococcales bacterium]MCB9533745.1 hypothetical protein [Myxococcales bacterium]
MNDAKNTKVQAPTKQRWESPRVQSSEVFTKAALACCKDVNNVAVGSSGASLPFC